MHFSYETNDFKSPAEDLNNIWIEVNELPYNMKNPKIIKHKRKKRKVYQTESDSEEEDENNLLDMNFEIEDSNSNFYSVNEAFSNNNNNDDNLSDTFPDNDIESFLTAPAEQIEIESEIDEYDEEIDINQLIYELRSHFPRNGGKIVYNGRKTSVINTCSIDYLIFSFYVLHRIDKNFLKKIPILENTDNLKHIVRKIAMNPAKWNEALEIWITKIAKYNEYVLNKTINTFGEESTFFLQYLKEYQEYILIKNCSENCIENGLLLFEGNLIFLRERGNKIELYYTSNNSGECLICKREIIHKIVFKNKTNFFFAQSFNTNISTIHVSDIPKQLFINEQTYSLILTTVNNNEHFYGIFYIKGNYYISDDITQSFELSEINTNSRKNKPLSYITSTSMYYLSEN